MLPLLIASSDNVASFINDVIQISTIWLYFLHDKKVGKMRARLNVYCRAYILMIMMKWHISEATCISLYSSLIPLLIFLLLIAVIKYASWIIHISNMQRRNRYSSRNKYQTLINPKYNISSYFKEKSKKRVWFSYLQCRRMTSCKNILYGLSFHQYNSLHISFMQLTI